MVNGALCGNFATPKLLHIFDLQNVNKNMLKSNLFIVFLHNKYQNNLVSLNTFNSVIINITKFYFSVSANSLRAKGFQSIGNLFFCQKFSLYQQK